MHTINPNPITNIDVDFIFTLLTSARRLRLEQGYLAPDANDPVSRGRIRRIETDDGLVRCVHTLKTGHGLVREEIEHDIPLEEYERLRPRTDEARLRKTRYDLGMSDDGVHWIVDVFDELDLHLAEVELPTPQTEAPPPSWLAGHIVREVTDDAEYGNFNLARRIAAD